MSYPNLSYKNDIRIQWEYFEREYTGLLYAYDADKDKCVSRMSSVSRKSSLLQM